MKEKTLVITEGGRETSMRKKKKLSSRKIVLLFILTTIVIVLQTISKFRSSVATNSTAKVAYPAIDLTSNQILETSINPDSTEKEFVFSVKNSNDENKTQVTMQYNIQIETLSNLPLEFELYTYNNETKGETNLLKENGNITDNFIFNDFVNDELNKYKLIIKWKEKETDYRYSNTIDYVRIKVNSEQVN